MRGCPEVKKLAKAPRISSLHFRRQTPGSATNVAFSNAKRRLDPDHPPGGHPKDKGFVWARSATAPFKLGAIPMGLLGKPETSFFAQEFDSFNARVARGASEEGGGVAPMRLHDPRHNRLPMSLQVATRKEIRPTQRSRILRRFKTALTLVATRAADAREVKGRLQLVFDDKGAEGHWILHGACYVAFVGDVLLKGWYVGWTYLLRPSLELYRMPYPEMVQLLRPMLRDIWTRGTSIEAEWAERVRALSRPRRDAPRQRDTWRDSPPRRESPQSESHERLPRAKWQESNDRPPRDTWREREAPPRDNSRDSPLRGEWKESAQSASHDRPPRDNWRDPPPPPPQRQPPAARPRNPSNANSNAPRTSSLYDRLTSSPSPPSSVEQRPAPARRSESFSGREPFDPRGAPSRAQSQFQPTPDWRTTRGPRDPIARDPAPRPPRSHDLPAFDPLPSRGAPPSASTRPASAPRAPQDPEAPAFPRRPTSRTPLTPEPELDALPADPAFDPFPTVSVRVPSAPSSAKPPDWWAIGRAIEEGVGKVVEVRADAVGPAPSTSTPTSASNPRPDFKPVPKENEKEQSVQRQSRVMDMLYRGDGDAVRPPAGNGNAGGKMRPGTVGRPRGK
ncbi:hypothetical protein B0H17DRAFT_1047030 [Mycena rosella]|uniref:Uncharacterized protein n=1 Tax=Mycena rosella TaxID=1033263 RepID=A0AAD7DVU0_MYCRO|nr:hypothetical protein B0H17DRAFT_1047030 [Mycena rosella]